MQNQAIQVKGLHKSYNKIRVLRGVDFAVEKGSIFVLLGSNGPLGVGLRPRPAFDRQVLANKQ